MHNNVRDKEIIKKLGVGAASIETGWTRSLEENLLQLQNEIAGLEARVQLGMSEGVPAAYAAKRIFEPENSTILVDLSQEGDPPVAMNYIVRDGQTYDIPIVLPGPGVFVAKYLTVSCYLKYFDDETGAYVEQLMTGNRQYIPATQVTAVDQAHLYTTKFSAKGPSGSQPADEVLWVAPDLFQNNPYPALNYFWNLLDSKSGVKLSDELMGQDVLLPRSREFSDPTNEYVFGDGGFFTFDTPFVFERDGQANFLFRPITPFLQEASIARPQSVMVQVELHGYRYETDQDAMIMGALSR
jgi:hypothetical protein